MQQKQPVGKTPASTQIEEMQRKRQSSPNQQKALSSPRYGLYAYGLIGRSATCQEIPGIDKKHPVYPVGGERICVIVSKIDIHRFQKQVQDLYTTITDAVETLQETGGAILQSHEEVVERIMQETTVVPLAFGTILKDEEAAVRMVQDNEEDFCRLLAKFQGKVEYGLKVYADRQALMRHLAQPTRGFAGQREQPANPSRGVAYLLGRKREEELKEAVAIQFTQTAEAIFQELAKYAFDAKRNSTLSQRRTGKKEEMILNATYFVEGERVAHFYQCGQRLKERYDFMKAVVEFSGPWPPYSFLEG